MRETPVKQDEFLSFPFISFSESSLFNSLWRKSARGGEGVNITSPGEPTRPPDPPAPWRRRAKRRGSRDRRSALPPSPSAPRTAPGPIGRKLRQAERLRRNRTLGLLLRGCGTRTEVEHLRNRVKKLSVFLKAGESTPVPTAILGRRVARAPHSRPNRYDDHGDTNPEVVRGRTMKAVGKSFRRNEELTPGSFRIIDMSRGRRRRLFSFRRGRAFEILRVSSRRARAHHPEGARRSRQGGVHQHHHHAVTPWRAALAVAICPRDPAGIGFLAMVPFGDQKGTRCRPKGRGRGCPRNCKR